MLRVVFVNRSAVGLALFDPTGWQRWRTSVGRMLSARRCVLTTRGGILAGGRLLAARGGMIARKSNARGRRGRI